MMIGEHGEIIDVFAPRPSEPSFEDVIAKALN